MKRKRKKKRSIEELLGPEYLASHERTQRLLAEQLARLKQEAPQEPTQGGEAAGA